MAELSAIDLDTLGRLVIWRAIGPGGSYVGEIHGKRQSVNRHWRAYCEGRNTPIRLVAAFKNHGVEAFKIEILEEVFDYVALRQREQYWVKYFDSFKDGYNGSKGGTCWKDPESPMAAAIRRWKNPEYKKRRREETRKLWKDPKYRAAATKNRSAILKKRWEDVDHRNKFSKAMKKVWSDPEFRSKRSIEASIAARALWQNPEFREKALEGIAKRIYSR